MFCHELIIPSINLLFSINPEEQSVVDPTDYILFHENKVLRVLELMIPKI